MHVSSSILTTLHAQDKHVNRRLKKEEIYIRNTFTYLGFEDVNLDRRRKKKIKRMRYGRRRLREAAESTSIKGAGLSFQYDRREASLFPWWEEKNIPPALEEIVSDSQALCKQICVRSKDVLVEICITPKGGESGDEDDNDDGTFYSGKRNTNILIYPSDLEK